MRQGRLPLGDGGGGEGGGGDHFLRRQKGPSADRKRERIS